MERPTTLKVMTRVMDAVTHLRESKGSTARGILDFIRQNSNTSNKILTMQVHKALRNAVNAGLLRHRNGRYKALTVLNPIACEVQEEDQSHESKPETMKRTEDQTNDKRSAYKVQPSRPRKRRPSEKRHRSRGKRRRSRQRRQARRRDVKLDLGRRLKRQRRRKTKEESSDDSPSRSVSKRRIVENIDLDVASQLDRRRSESRSIKSISRSNCSTSDDSEEEFQKPYRVYSNKKIRPDSKCLRSRRSMSRNRSPQRQFQQQEQANDLRRRENKTENREDHGMECDDDPEETEIAQHSTEEHNQSGSGSTL